MSTGSKLVAIGVDQRFIGHRVKIQNPDDVGQRNDVVSVPLLSASANCPSESPPVHPPGPVASGMGA